MVDERKHKRVQVMSYLKICYRDTDIELGRAVDISTEGMRLCSREPIQTSRTLTFRFSLPAISGHNQEVLFDADVIWCRRAKDPDLYDTGIRIKNLTPEMIKKIEDFMETSSQDDRWLSILKTFNED